MGAWGTGVFENDDAADLLGDIEDVSDFELIEAAIDQVLEIGPEYLESPEASRAIAAAAILARMNDPRFDLGSEKARIDQWIAKAKAKPNPELLGKGRQAVNRVMAEPSELLELWSESGESDEWKATVSKVAMSL